MASPTQKRKRPDKFEHFLNRAKVAAEMSTCLRRRIGAIIVKDGVELSSGYVGSPRGTEHCTDIGKCLRKELGIPPVGPQKNFRFTTNETFDAEIINEDIARGESE